ncbi:hypothetical protein SAMN05443287_1049 [Micromonospora phaseoli]|uniref:Uncharacterized protein n=1 Tax=Micromonospora phaseoli TaxID=1144548 RepID=A0A1H6Y3S9_9ACTN|nr:hypothetical protein [Micromonospora phaseoli]PZV99981.1 hypothetical protein CLV64_1038 [Micromonospora phaseoli]GIJ81199.1 hypothetical protein Xph01_56310 [Micromonospora phaseoli]SEJ35096.1 hypothetical protein SAMN05443287_1049 [Micromonospora phaseoli]
MPDPASFTDDENWSGGFYELSLQWDGRDGQGLQRGLSALWGAAAVDGCYGSRSHEPGDQEEVPCTVESLMAFGHLRGTVLLPSGDRVVCGCVTLGGDGEPEWLDFYLPLGALARVDQRIGGFPFDSRSGEDSLAWRRPLDGWLAAVGTRIFRDAPFRLGLIGFELDGRISSNQINGHAPDPRWEGYLLPVGEDLRYEPATR